MADDEGDDDRVRWTQRLPKQLAADIEAYAEDMGMSRNAAMTMAARQLVNQNGYDGEGEIDESE